MSEQESKIDDGSVVPKSLEGAINWIPDDGSIAEALRQSMSSPPYCCSHYGGNPEVSPKDIVYVPRIGPGGPIPMKRVPRLGPGGPGLVPYSPMIG